MSDSGECLPTGYESEPYVLPCSIYDASSQIVQLTWYRHPDAAIFDVSDRVAFYARNGEEVVAPNMTEKDLTDRAWLDTATGDLNILSLSLTDGGLFYTCEFIDKTKTDILHVNGQYDTHV